MKKVLRTLFVEHSEDDAELLRLHLECAGYQVMGQRVETALEMRRALEAAGWDLCLSDYALPSFGAAQALAIVAELQIDLPFIVVSGTIGESRATEVMRLGAHDFVLKYDFARLDPAIERELREFGNRRARRAAEAERERLLEELMASNRRKDDFLAMLGHELRNPLAPISTALQVIQLRGGDDPFSKEHRIIRRQVDHLTRLVDDLLDVSRIAHGNIELRKSTVEISEFVARGIEMASPLLEKGNHRLTTNMPRAGLKTEGDPLRLAQVISNLVTNAAKYMAPGGSIMIGAEQVGERIVIRVRDTGPGIAPELLPRVFDLFVQGERTIDRRQGGLGLGLSIVKSFVEMHGGSVSVQSQLGKGAEFVLQLPHSLEPTAPLHVEHAAPGAQRGLRVLVVDDNADAAILLAEALMACGHRCRVAHDGPEAIAAAEDFDPQIALLDIGLPVMDGYEVGLALRKRCDEVRLVAITGYGQDADRSRSLEAGFEAHLVKPVSLSQIERVLQLRAPA